LPLNHRQQHRLLRVLPVPVTVPFRLPSSRLQWYRSLLGSLCFCQTENLEFTEIGFCLWSAWNLFSSSGRPRSLDDDVVVA
jgi:hypothetical protein